MNHELVHHWPDQDEIMTIDGTAKAARLMDFLPKLAAADIVIAIGGTKLESIAASYMKMMRKKMVVLSHGYLPYENNINHLHFSQTEMMKNRDFLAGANAVVAVSRHHMHFLEQQQPELIGHVAYINNAINPFIQQVHREYAGHGTLTVAVSGGDRPIKGNENVAKSVQKLRHQGIDCRLSVFGDIEGNNPEFDRLLDQEWVTNNGQMQHKAFLSELRKADVFVMNSVYEPFGLSALDALEAGCPVLLSSHCGVNDVLDIRGSDVIRNIKDTDEIGQKILAVAQHSNAYRLYQSIDFKSLNWTVSASRLSDICHAVSKGQSLRKFTL